ncbi:exported hypothetical protein [Candidatus Sulfopaludibacter sp. SbA3]|nr:exported hypothetical protein [Candidatus Sulfopaludibacter sp. SbA3]
MRIAFVVVTVTAVLLLTAGTPRHKVSSAHFETTYSGIEERWARGLTETLEVARSVYVEDFRFDMPDRVTFDVQCDAGLETKLYTNGNGIFLRLAKAGDLVDTASSPYHNLYGMCHELGHIAMGRALGPCKWMRHDANEAWAHYIGSLVVDRLYQRRGPGLWPDPYDYRVDGVARLRKPEQGGADAAAAWYALGTVIGTENFPRLFAAWRVAKLDPHDPSAGLESALRGVDPKDDGSLREFWKRAATLLANLPARR